MDKQYAIFDMDGTLVDSMTLWDNVVLEYLESQGITGEFADLLIRLKTMSVPEGLRLLQSFFR